MKATLLKTVCKKSNYGGHFYYAFFKGEDGRSYRSCLFPQCGNFKRWQRFVGKEAVELENLNVRGDIVDADSYPREINNGKEIDGQRDLGRSLVSKTSL